MEDGPPSTPSSSHFFGTFLLLSSMVEEVGFLLAVEEEGLGLEEDEAFDLPDMLIFRVGAPSDSNKATHFYNLELQAGIFGGAQSSTIL